MKISNDAITKALLAGKVNRFEKKIADGDITFNDCGLSISKNFMSLKDTVLIDSDDELKEYCENMCAECPYEKCAVFLIYHDHRVSCVVKMSFNDFDVFDLDESWHCWNFVSIEENFELSAYGVLCEVEPGEWKTIID